MAVSYGRGLLGAGVFTAIVLFEPYWENIGPLFSAFVAYDLTLLYPLVYLLSQNHKFPIVLYRLLAYFCLILLTLLMVTCYSIYALKKNRLSKKELRPSESAMK